MGRWRVANEIETWKEIARLGGASEKPGGPVWSYRVKRVEELIAAIRRRVEDENLTAYEVRFGIEELLHDFDARLLNDHVRQEYEASEQPEEEK
jgi:hypothetical protein